MDSGRNTFWLQAYMALMISLFLFYVSVPDIKQELEHMSFVVVVCPLNLEDGLVGLLHRNKLDEPRM